MCWLSFHFCCYYSVVFKLRSERSVTSRNMLFGLQARSNSHLFLHNKLSINIFLLLQTSILVWQILNLNVLLLSFLYRLYFKIHTPWWISKMRCQAKMRPVVCILPRMLPELLLFYYCLACSFSLCTPSSSKINWPVTDKQTKKKKKKHRVISWRAHKQRIQLKTQDLACATGNWSPSCSMPQGTRLVVLLQSFAGSWRSSSTTQGEHRHPN